MSHAYLSADNPRPAGQLCTKIAFNTRLEARKVMRNMPKQHSRPTASGKGKIHVWRCSVCGLYHLGHD